MFCVGGGGAGGGGTRPLKTLSPAPGPIARAVTSTRRCGGAAARRRGLWRHTIDRCSAIAPSPRRREPANEHHDVPSVKSRRQSARRVLCALTRLLFTAVSARVGSAEIFDSFIFFFFRSILPSKSPVCAVCSVHNNTADRYENTPYCCRRRRSGRVKDRRRRNEDEIPRSTSKRLWRDAVGGTVRAAVTATEISHQGLCVPTAPSIPVFGS